MREQALSLVAAIIEAQPKIDALNKDFLEADYRQNPLHQVDGWRLGLDGTQWPVPMVVGAEIEDGRYRIHMCPV